MRNTSKQVPSADPALWGAPFRRSVIDQDPAAEGIQYRDVGGAAPGNHYYLVTAVAAAGSAAGVESE